MAKTLTINLTFPLGTSWCSYSRSHGERDEGEPERLSGIGFLLLSLS